MDSCDEHGNLKYSFFCSTCSVRVCPVCMERGDHVIPEHRCIPLSLYFEEKSSEIRTLLNNVTQNKTKYDQIKSKWDTHLSSLESKFGELKNDIRHTKQHLLQQMDLAEQRLLLKAENAKSRKETAIKGAKLSHEQKFAGIYQQLNEKCQFVLQKLANFTFSDEVAFQECHNLLKNLRKELKHFETEKLLGISLTFESSNTCFLGEMIASKDAGKTLSTDVEQSIKKKTGNHAQKRRKTDTGIGVAVKQKKGDSKLTSDYVKRSNHVSISGTAGAYPGGDGKRKKEKRKKERKKKEKKEKKKESREKTKRTKNKERWEKKRKKKEKQKEETLTAKSNAQQSSHDVNVAGTSTINVTKRSPDASHVNKASTSTWDDTCHTATDTQSPSTPLQLKAPSFVLEKNGNSIPEFSSLGVSNTSVWRVIKSQESIVVDACCAGIVWADNDWLLEVSKTKFSIKIKHHKISDRSQLGSDSIISCEQNMEDVELYVCPKFHSPDCSFVVAFKDQIAVISLKNHGLPEVTWKRIPTNLTILAISWRKHPPQFAAIVKESDHKVSLMREISDGSDQYFDIRTISNVDFYHCHPLDISSYNEFAIGNTLSGSILFFSVSGVISPTRQVEAPSFLINGQPLCLLVKDDKKEWLVLWKGTSSSDGQLKWAIARYNSSFIFLSTVIQFPYQMQHEEPKAFFVHGNNLAVLHNSLEMIFHKNISTLS